MSADGDADDRLRDEHEDWRVFHLLCSPHDNANMEVDDMPHDIATALRSELAALQYKKDRLQAELQDARNQMRGREQRAVEVQAECENLREQSARQSAVICSLKKRQNELEERERGLSVTSGRVEADLQTSLRDRRYLEDKVKEMEKRIRCLELECNAEEQQKEVARKSMHDFLRRLAVALGTEFCDSMGTCSDSLVHKASELVQETSRLRAKASTTCDNLTSTEVELRTCRDTLERNNVDRDALQRQVATNLMEIDRLRQDKETLEMQQRVAERELAELRDKVAMTSRTLGNATGSLVAQEAQMSQLKEEVKCREEKAVRSQCELRRVLEGLAVQLSSPARFVDAQEESIRERIRELQHECKERSVQLETVREKANLSSHQLSRAIEQGDISSRRLHVLEDDKASLESRMAKVESELAAAEVSRDAFRRDKSIYLGFLERLGRALNMDEISKDVGVDLHTDSLLARAEQLARLESEKLVDKLLLTDYAARLRREKLYSEVIPLTETAAVYQLQRRVRTLREQLQRRDLHLDLLRRKLTLQEDNCRIRSLLEGERDEANLRVKKMLKQVDRVQLQLAESRAQVRDLKTQLADATEYKISALERGRKVEELEKRLTDSELMRTKYNRKVTILKDQVRNVGQSVVEERSAHDHDVLLLREDLVVTKHNLAETQKRENQLLSLRATVGRLLGVDPARSPVPDYDIVNRLQKLVHAQREFANVSRRYEEPLRLLPPSPRRSATPGGGCADLLLRTPDSRTLRYDDIDLPDLSPLSELDDLNGVYNKRPHMRPST